MRALLAVLSSFVAAFAFAGEIHVGGGASATRVPTVSTTHSGTVPEATFEGAPTANHTSTTTGHPTSGTTKGSAVSVGAVHMNPSTMAPATIAPVAMNPAQMSPGVRFEGVTTEGSGVHIGSTGIHSTPLRPVTVKPLAVAPVHVAPTAVAPVSIEPVRFDTVQISEVHTFGETPTNHRRIRSGSVMAPQIPRGTSGAPGLLMAGGNMSGCDAEHPVLILPSGAGNEENGGWMRFQVDPNLEVKLSTAREDVGDRAAQLTVKDDREASRTFQVARSDSSTHYYVPHGNEISLLASENARLHVNVCQKAPTVATMALTDDDESARAFALSGH